MNCQNIIFILSVITIFHVNTAQMPLTQKNTQNKGRCYLTILPNHVQDLIAQYLTFDDIESEEEFIARTKTGKELASIFSKYKEHLISPRERFFSGLEKGWHVSKILMAHCPNEENIAFLRFLYAGINAMPELIIINAHEDIDKHVIKNRISWESKRENIYFIALSRHGHMFATLSQELEIPFTDLKKFDSFNSFKQYPIKQTIVIEETVTQNVIQYISFLNSLENPKMDFNKQGTHIIVHGFHSSKQDKTIGKESLLDYRIFPITIGEQSIIPLKKTLQHYFLQRGICKQIPYSIEK